MICESGRFIFIHVPRTAGTSIEYFLYQKHPLNFEKTVRWERADYVPQVARGNSQLDLDVKTEYNIYERSHILARQYESSLKKRSMTDKWDSYFKFGFVRNPWDRVVSLFHLVKQKRPKMAFEQLGINQESPFEEFCHALHRVPDQEFRWPLHNYISQTQWYSNDDGEVSVDFIGKFEHLEKDFKTICNNLNWGFTSLGKVNAFKRKHYSEFYTEETKQIVEERYSMDIERFGYQFQKQQS